MSEEIFRIEVFGGAVDDKNVKIEGFVKADGQETTRFGLTVPARSTKESVRAMLQGILNTL